MRLPYDPRDAVGLFVAGMLAGCGLCAFAVMAAFVLIHLADHYLR